ncbi:MAG: hypothetical protein ACJ76X_04820 [Solirubrobacteraceae bacterium]
MRLRRWAAGLAVVLPIPFVPGPPGFLGSPAAPHAVRGVAATPRSPFMAANGRSEIHNDAWQTDAYRGGGPLGRSPRTLSSMLVPAADCGSITFDRAGRLISVCVGASGPRLYMFDPATLNTLASFALPPRQDIPSNIFQDYTGGGYFYLDSHDRVVTATTTKHIYMIASGAGGFRLVGDYDLSHVLTSSEKITSALPDSHGLLWFVARSDGVVGTLNFRTRAIHVVRLGRGADGEIENSFAVDPVGGGVYIASNRRLYRFTAGRGGRPRVVWKVRYPNSGLHKLGQVDDGTGTTPTVMPGGLVSITDNADPMDVVVYRTAARLGRHVPRQVCRVPVFQRGASATENSLIGAGRSMVVENNYGYDGPAAVALGKLSAPGFARVDVNRSGTGCRLVWTNSVERAPSVVPKLSLRAGLVYTYTKDPGALDPWSWTALDFRTGRTVYKVLAGTGSIGYNNNYAGIAAAPGGRGAYLGVLGGLIAFFDS